jgi:fumarylacetoacetase
MIPGSDRPKSATSQKLVYEVELGVFVSQPVPYGETVPASRARDHIFGFVLLNDWSARDIQFFEMTPLVPFNGKGTATSISPWVVTLEALEEAGAVIPCEAGDQVGGKNTSIPFLQCQHDVSVQVSSYLSRKYHPGGIRAGQFSDTLGGANLDIILGTGGPKRELLGRSDLKHLHWSPFQMLAHHSSSGCGLTAGDLLGTGTLSSTEEQAAGFEKYHDSIRRSGCLQEIVQAGKKPFPLSNGSELVYLEDGDTVTIEGWAGSGDSAIGFGSLSR